MSTPLDRLRALRSRFAGDGPPPPVPADAGVMVEIAAELDAFYLRSTARFDRAFLNGHLVRPARRERPLFDRLASVGVTRPLPGGLHAPCVRLTRFQGRLFATDLATRNRPDHVFALMFEQVYMIRNLRVQPGEDVLELCVGCGANSLFAADVAASVTAVDVSPRALAFARFNQALGPAAVPLDLRAGSLFEPIARDMRFDRIFVNPPFEAVPPAAHYPLHSDGGEDGLDVVRALLADLPGHLAPGGQFQMITWSPGDAAGALVTEICRAALPRHALHVHKLDMGPLTYQLEPFEEVTGYDAWCERLAARGLTHLHVVFLHAVPADVPTLTVSRPRAEVAACWRIARTFHH